MPVSLICTKPTCARMKITKSNSQVSSFRFHTRLFHVSKNNKTPTSKHSANSRNSCKFHCAKLSKRNLHVSKNPNHKTKQKLFVSFLFSVVQSSPKTLHVLSRQLSLVSQTHNIPRAQSSGLEKPYKLNRHLTNEEEVDDQGPCSSTAPCGVCHPQTSEDTQGQRSQLPKPCSSTPRQNKGGPLRGRRAFFNAKRP